MTVTIYRISSASEPEKAFYYMAFGQQLSIPEFARVLSEGALRVNADDVALSRPSSMESFRRAMRAKGCYIEFQQAEAESLVAKVGARIEELIIDVWKPERGGLQDENTSTG